MEILDHSTPSSRIKNQVPAIKPNEQRQNENEIVYDLDIDVFEGRDFEEDCSVSNTCASCSCTCSCATCGSSCPYCS